MIHFVIGTRAQLFKMAPIMLECEARSLAWRWIYTAQHKETISQTIQTFGLKPPDYTVIKWSTEAKSIGKMWLWLFKVIPALFRGRKILGGYTGKNHVVLTHGDTISTWWGALLGKLYKCKVMHVESGLRSFNLFKPFPEEINRLVTFKVSDYYAAPGKWAMNNLKKYNGKKINTEFNTQLDTIKFGMENCEAADVKIPRKKYIVCSIHRYENVYDEERFEKIINLIEKLSDKFTICWVQHPVTESRLNKLVKLKSKLDNNENIKLYPRLDYLPFIKLAKNSEFVVTDGGGNQEELYYMGKPTLIFRNETERQEGLGKTAVVSKLETRIIDNFLDNYKKYQQPPIVLKKSPSKLIVNLLRSEGFGE